MRGGSVLNLTDTMVSLLVLHKGLENIVEKLKVGGHAAEDTVHTPFTVPLLLRGTV